MNLSSPNDNRASSAAIPVSQLNLAVARLLERSFPLAWISGEISNFTRAASGHWYFTLKDDAAQVRAVMFRSRAQLSGFLPREGDKVEVRALVTLYAPRGDFQLNVEAIRRAGIGNLFEAFMRLKDKLATEGLFDTARKRPLPAFPKTIGIVSSLQAAALRDVLATLARRAPQVRVILYPTPVQGDGAARQIAQAITTASRRNECDLLLLCRGGGSIEDLWAFNEEPVARAIAACAMPVISGVGHETDVTIADFTADLRAPTPTAAAELACRSRNDWHSDLQALANLLTRAMQRHLNESTQSVDWLARRLLSPAARITRERWQLQALSTRLKAQLPDTAQARLELAAQARRLQSGLSSFLARQQHVLAALASQLELLNPQRTLERGYAIVTTADGDIARNPSQLHAGDRITLQLAHGSAAIDIADISRDSGRPQG